MKFNFTYKLKGANSNLDTQITENEIMGSYRSFTPSGFYATNNLDCYNPVIPTGLVNYAINKIFNIKLSCITPSGFCATNNLNCYNHFIPSGLIDYASTGLFKKKPERLTGL